MEVVKGDSEQQVPEYLELPLLENEFTGSELLHYYNNGYGSMLGGIKFTIQHLSKWVILGKVPEAYGGNALSARGVSGIRIFTVSGLTREEVRYVRSIERQQLPKVNIPTVNRIKKQKPLPRRTRLYYQLAKLPVPEEVLPPNWKAVGIRGNQLTHKSKKYLHKKK